MVAKVIMPQVNTCSSQTLCCDIENNGVVFTGFGYVPSCLSARLVQYELKFLGHIISAGGIQVDPAKVSIVKNRPVPEGKHDMQNFLGLANYFCKLVMGYAQLVAPMQQLPKKDKDHAWTEECNAAFTGVKNALLRQLQESAFAVFRGLSMLLMGLPQSCGFQLVCSEVRAVNYVSGVYRGKWDGSLSSGHLFTMS